MGTQTLQDIKNDIKLLIKTITGFEENDSEFRTCEKFAYSRINSHGYLTVSAQETKKKVAEIIDKITIHGKQDVAQEFRSLVDTFLSSFDFDRHPQSDLQWSLLTFLISLSSEIRNSTLNNLNQSISFNDSSISKNEVEEVDWGVLLKEGQEDFFQDFGSDSESVWSDDNEVDKNNDEEFGDIQIEEIEIEKVEQTAERNTWFKHIKEENVAKSWLVANVQSNWWNEIDWNQCKVVSKFPTAKFCEFWRKNIIKSTQIIGTISEYKAIRELLWMLINPAQMLLFQEEEKLKFSVRDNVTIPSLTIIAFKGILQPYCEYFTMIRELQNFSKHCYKSNDKRHIPLTYETYNAALMNHLLQIQNEIIEIERNVMKQDQIHTLLSVSNDLKSLLYKIKLLYKVHKIVTDDLLEISNENAVAKLLSGLYFHVENAINKEEMYIYTSLYLSSITVYLNIIDTWMSEGRLEDWREEFLISRNAASFNSEEGLQSEKFVVKSVNVAYTTDPLIKLISEKVSQMGRNMDLLVTLGRMSELWSFSEEKTRNQTCLSTEFLNKILSELSEYNNTSSEDSVDCIEKMEIDQPETSDDELSQIVTRQLLQTDNLFLLTAFENFMPNSTVADSVDGKNKSENDHFNKRLEKLLDPVLPVRKIIQQSLIEILDTRYSNTSKLVKDILIKEYKLEEHLKLMRYIYMMENSHLMNKFIFQFFTQVETNSTWTNSSVLTHNLGEILSEKWPETSSRWSVSIDTLRTNQVLQAIDNINLHYAIGWPINMLLNDNVLAKYNSIFKFHLKLKWALWTLSNLNFSDFEGSRLANIKNNWQLFHVKRLESLRFWLFHAIGSIHSYICGQVLQSLAYVLEKSLSQAEDLDTIINLHNEFLDTVYEHCLQTDQFVNLREIINKLFEICIEVRNKWKRGFKFLTSTELDTLEKKYVHHHTCLALALHSAAINFKDADYLTILESAFTCSMPET